MAGKGKPGPPRIRIGQSELAHILDLMGKGHGRMRACTMAGVAYRTFQKRLAKDSDLRDQVVQAERARVDDMTKLVYDLKDHEDASIRLNAAKVFLHRDDRQREARRAMRERREAAGVGDGEKLSAVMPRVGKVLLRYCPEELHGAMIEDLKGVAEELEAAGG